MTQERASIHAGLWSRPYPTREWSTSLWNGGGLITCLALSDRPIYTLLSFHDGTCRAHSHLRPSPWAVHAMQVRGSRPDLGPQLVEAAKGDDAKKVVSLLGQGAPVDFKVRGSGGS